MASFSDRTLRRFEDQRHDLIERLSDLLSELREEIGARAENLNRLSSKRLSKAHREANALTQAAREQMPVIARQIGHQALRTGQSLRKDPVPAVVMVGTFALLASLVLHDTRR